MDGIERSRLIENRWQQVLARVAAAAHSVGRPADEVTVVAVSKTRGADEVAAALQAGVTDVGENRVQEAVSKRAKVTAPARWHLIGGLQRNKAGKAVDTFDVVQSVDSERLADALDQRAGRANRRAGAAGRRLEVLLQVNTSGATQQGGIEPEALPGLAEHAAGLAHLHVGGLMTIAAHDESPAVVRGCFARLRQLAEDLRQRGPAEVSMATLSMGMSGDFELAIQEGATCVRIGTAIFGSRPPSLHVPLAGAAPQGPGATAAPEV